MVHVAKNSDVVQCSYTRRSVCRSFQIEIKLVSYVYFDNPPNARTRAKQKKTSIDWSESAFGRDPNFALANRGKVVAQTKL